MTRLPGWYHADGNPDRYLRRRSRRHLERYAASYGAPVHERTDVQTLSRGPDGHYDVHTDRGTWTRA